MAQEEVVQMNGQCLVMCQKANVLLWEDFLLLKNMVIVLNVVSDKNVGQSLEDHFIDVNKMIIAGKGAQRDVDEDFCSHLFQE